jgi:hypothetical protein
MPSTVRRASVKPSRQLHLAIGLAALVAPALHTVTDLMEWHNRGFTDAQLWLNFVAFLPMPLLLVGIHAVQRPRPGVAGLLGALLYGAAFAYFLYTTLYALAERVPDYEELWARLGPVYTFCGGLMVGGGLLFGWAALRVGWLPRSSVLLFLAGIVVNLVLAVLPAPDILQTVGSAMRNFGLMGMGYAILSKLAPAAP